MVRLSAWALLSVAAGTAKAQFSGWVENQISTEICTWEQPRAAIIQDMIYLDGGNINWLPRLKDGTTGAVADNGNNEGIILNYNLSTPFDSTTNVTAILLKDAMSKSRGGKGNSNGAAPNYVDGGMLANNDEFFLYGGVLIENTQLYQDPASDEVLAYQAYQYGVDKPSWNPGFIDGVLSDNVTRYIAYGATVNAPSENKAWYFSGLQSDSHGTIYSNAENDTTTATDVSSSFIELDMSVQLSETWTNRTLPKSVPGRSNAEVVWVPIGKEGILVVLGGATYPYWASGINMSPNENASEAESPAFMSTIDIYDIANKKWYQQPTEDGPKTRARGCAVVAPASDRSSFNIFYYGGMDGIHVTEAYSDEVWVLSLPSFTWTRINAGKSLHARAGHKCFTPYPDQMMILGGYTPLAGSAITCLQDGPVVMFNLSSGEWMNSYDPAKHADYGVNSKILSKIGGDSTGGATATTPLPSGWATSALAQVFETTYTSKISTYYPYATEASSTGSPNNTDTDNGGGGGGGSSLPKWVAPVLGVVLGLVFVSGALVVFFLWRRRKVLRNQSDYGTEDTRSRIRSWMRGQQTEKAPTVTTSDDTPISPDMEIARTVGTTPSNNAPPGPPAEMADTQVAELADTSAPVELHDTGLTPMEIIQKHSHFADTKTRSPTDPSYSSFTTGQDQASSISRPSGVPSSGVVNPVGDDTSARVASDVSGVSDTDAANLRRLSAIVPVSPRSESGDIPALAPKEKSTDVSPAPGSPTPVSPPTAGEDTSSPDYLSAKPTISPLRKSIFKEHDEDMDKEQ